jgi:hypothetical protein
MSHGHAQRQHPSNIISTCLLTMPLLVTHVHTYQHRSPVRFSSFEPSCTNCEQPKSITRTSGGASC